jgi:hypothetical protein
VEDAAKARIAGSESTRELVQAHLAALFQGKEAALAETELAHYVPLRKTVTFSEYLDRTTRAITRAVQNYRSPGTGLQAHSPANTSRFERRLESAALGVAGSADIYEESEAEIVIRDCRFRKLWPPSFRKLWPPEEGSRPWPETVEEDLT